MKCNEGLEEVILRISDEVMMMMKLIRAVDLFLSNIFFFAKIPSIAEGKLSECGAKNIGVNKICFLLLCLLKIDC